MSELITRIHDYNIIKTIGCGASGTVYLASNIKTDEHFALKRVPKGSQSNEIRLHSKVTHHQTILNLIKVISDDSYDYLVLEYCNDGDLFEYIVNQTESSRLQHEERHRNYILQIIRAIRVCKESKVYHRDIKPENILLVGDQIRLGDFGLATDNLITSDSGCGSTCYLSPESISSDQPFSTHQSDIWSLGILIINLMCGLNPWKVAHHQDCSYRDYLRDPLYLHHHLGITYDFYTILVKALHPDPDTRSNLDDLEWDIINCPHFLSNPLTTPSLSECLSNSSLLYLDSPPLLQDPLLDLNPSPYHSYPDNQDDDHYGDPYLDPHSKYALYFHHSSQLLVDDFDFDLTED